jgi:hypothetical protein
MGWRKLVPLCLERAGAVPLAVDIAVPDSRGDEAFLSALLPHVPRIDSLRLTGYSSAETVADDLPGFFTSPMLNLTSLELQQTAEPAQLFPSDNTPMPPLFRGVSKLKSLSLTRTPLYPSLFTIGSLVELKLIGYTSPFHFGTFLRLLDSNPGLEVVVLDIQFVTDSVETTLTRKVPLARLQHLFITCSKPIDSKGLLSCISPPRGVRLEVVSTQSTRPPDLGSFLPSPPTSIQELLAPVTTIRSQRNPWEVHLSGGSSVFSFRCSESPSTFYSELSLFPTATVREFHTDIQPHNIWPTLLPWVLGNLPALEVLAISRDAINSGVLSVLAQEPVLCPALKTIAFFNCSVAQSQINELETAVAKRKETTAARLYSVVIVTNNPKASLDLGLIHQLRKFVPRVKVRVDDKLPNLLQSMNVQYSAFKYV